jgi:hypothetical protein
MNPKKIPITFIKKGSDSSVNFKLDEGSHNWRLDVGSIIRLDSFVADVYTQTGEEVTPVIQPNYFQPQIRVGCLSVELNEWLVDLPAYGAVPKRVYPLHLDQDFLIKDSIVQIHDFIDRNGIEVLGEYRHINESCDIILTVFLETVIEQRRSVHLTGYIS